MLDQRACCCRLLGLGADRGREHEGLLEFGGHQTDIVHARSRHEDVADEQRKFCFAFGYRLGHLQDDGRVFRALVYNKSALVLHMLRRWVGDDAFFRGLRALYAQSRYTKIGTRHVQRAFEAESGLDLSRFFEGWIRTSDIPRLRASFEPAGASVTVRLDQIGPVMDVPVTVTVVYASGATDDHLVKLSQGSTFVKLPASGPVRSIELNRDEQALIVVERGSGPRGRAGDAMSSRRGLQQPKPSN